MEYLCPARVGSLDFLSVRTDSLARPRRARPLLRAVARPMEEQMLDIAFLALGLVWFAACLGYTAFCDRL
jgi:hypothetical protein